MITQPLMDKQIILAVDDSGNFQEYILKDLGHQGKGRRHLAITVLLINSQNQVLLQKRKHRIFDNIWDLTGATHPLHKQDNTDETLEQAASRCLQTEYSITEKVNLKNLGFFNYFARYGEFCENEHCYLLAGKYDGEVKLNPNMGYEYKWMNKKEFLKDIKNNPQNYTPWAQKSASIL